MNDVQLIDLVRETDAYASHTPLPDSTWTREFALHEIERRRGMSDSTLTNRDAPGTEQAEPSGAPVRPIRKQRLGRRWSPALVGGLAFALIVVILAAVALRGGEQDAAERAESIAGEFFDAFNAGDADAVLALFADDAVRAWQFRPDPPDVFETQGWEQRLAWNMAQGTTLMNSTCTLPELGLGETVSIQCSYETWDALSQAADGPSVPTTTTMVINADGVIEFTESYGRVDFTTLGIPFNHWVDQAHPGESAVLDWTSVEDARRHGERRAQFATEWVTFLEENGCTNPTVICI